MILEAIKEAIETGLGLDAVIYPQAAKTGTAHIELLYKGIAAAGEAKGNPAPSASETISFAAFFRTNGTGTKWLAETIRHERKLAFLEAEYLPVFVPVPGGKAELRLYWSRQDKGAFEYPSIDDGGMPVSYAAEFELNMTYPAHLLDGEE
ncbi:hypothetical protein [Treponema endosymbiont of Eucomonympha sp.]|uniref:hypothetical protein n=1 Tax=Treponema endosymbiont of Eucomonympha sp. TaxID=1580831 RepID=UPI0007514535|nr:hypothetical protein [Treponema endosymbiont of Eucomonympha sp.]